MYDMQHKSSNKGRCSYVICTFSDQDAPPINIFLVCMNRPHLHHLGMDVEAGVAQLSDLLGQELHPLSGVTEDD